MINYKVNIQLISIININEEIQKDLKNYQTQVNKTLFNDIFRITKKRRKLNKKTHDIFSCFSTKFIYPANLIPARNFFEQFPNKATKITNQ